MKKITLRDLIFYAVIVMILMATVLTLQGLERGKEESYASIRALLEREKVSQVVVDGSTVTLTLKEPDEDGRHTVSYNLYSFELFYEDFNELIVRQWRLGTIEDYNYPEDPTPPWWSTIIPYVAIFVVFGILWYFMFMRQSGGGGGADRTARFGRARTRTLAEGAKKVTFDEVAGAEEEKAELEEIVEFLKDPKRFIALGARIPKGVLLVGPPGTGKTLIARAVAGEAGVNFLSISGSDFVELYVGVGASRVRDLFDQAKKDSPAIVFIDEIDAVGRQRGAGLGGGHDEREQTLNQLLVEMDGFSANEGVIVLAATNRQDILDPALLRPGRFDRQVFVGHPDMKGREAILKVHARGKPLAEDVDLGAVAKSTGGFTGADLENLLNEAALLAAKRRQRFIMLTDIQESVIKVIAGPEKRSKTVIERERRLTAYHEAGHALVTHELETQDPVHQISIIPRGAAGGMTIHLPREDRSYRSKKELEEHISVLLGGRVAEELVFGDVSTGASDDLRRASETARAMVTKYGMSDRVGHVTFTTGRDEVFIGRSMAQAKTYSEEMAALIDLEVKRIIDEAHVACTRILTGMRPKMDQVAEYLLEHENMDAQTFEKIFD